MDLESATNISKTSLNLISNTSKTNEAYLPVSSLPYSKDIIRSAFKQFLVNGNLSKAGKKSIEMKYRLLANFLDDKKAKFINMVDNSLKQVDIKNNAACKSWVQDPKNNEAYSKYITILCEIDAERKKLNNELELIYTENK